MLIRGIEEQSFWSPLDEEYIRITSGSVIFLPQSDPKPMPNDHLHPWKINMETPQREIWKMIFPFQLDDI